ncbi:alpha/beta hydrolase [Candidatus Entotheonella palauensis]|uniref:alpha/beta hydrolase n=1 Tax=Candidatus Entotheonella palauensis TaxID=93172 RepID=UPI000B7D3936|nr:alpha/beta fold hydrolase [Candidatus Entotheonella palauensis]
MDLLHTIYEPAGEGPHPTILTLHGRGANAMDLLGLAPHLAGGRFLIICPQGPVQTPIGPGMVGYGWYPSVPGQPPDMDAILAARQQLRAFLQAAEARYDIDRNKLLVLGFSQGGVMAYTMALIEPERFAALIALSTWLPEEMLEHVDDRATLQQLPTLIQHGSRDELVEVDRARRSVEMLREQRVPLTYREYEMGHEINSQSLTDLVQWLQDKGLSPVLAR